MFKRLPLFGQFEFSYLELAILNLSAILDLRKYYFVVIIGLTGTIMSLVAHAIVEDMFVLWGLRHQLAWSI